MAVDQHPSRRPSPPRKPPATSTTDGQPNTVAKTETGDGTMQYGSMNGRHMKMQIREGSGERKYDFMPFGASEGKAPHPGKEASNEGPKGKDSKPGDEGMK